jgi:hypothetical protein
MSGQFKKTLGNQRGTNGINRDAEYLEPILRQAISHLQEFWGEEARVEFENQWSLAQEGRLGHQSSSGNENNLLAHATHSASHGLRAPHRSLESNILHMRSFVDLGAYPDHEDVDRRSWRPLPLLDDEPLLDGQATPLLDVQPTVEHLEYAPVQV